MSGLRSDRWSSNQPSKIGHENVGEITMLDKIKGVVAGGVDIGVMLIGLAIVLQIVFGGSVPFLGGDVIGTVIGIVGQLGAAGLTGLIAAAVLWKLFDRD